MHRRAAMSSFAVARASAAAILIAIFGLSGLAAPRAEQAGALRPPSAFSSIADARERSAALFVEAGKVLTDARCVNCHPAGNQPLQGDDQHIHVPVALRGAEGVGVPGAYCATCHMDENVTLLAAPARSIPGHPRWQLAPPEMAWQGRSLGAICQQIKDPQRNGGKSLAEIQEHMAHDDLVAWGWNPGSGRRPAPGTQAELGADRRMDRDRRRLSLTRIAPRGATLLPLAACAQ